MIENMNRFFRLVTRFAMLNALWIGFTVLGLGVFGLFPATVSLFSISRKWIQGNEELPLLKSFVSYFKSVFVKANLVGWLAGGIGAVLYLNYRLIRQAGADVPLLVTVSFIIIVIFFTLMGVSAFPVSVHFTGGLIELFKKTAMFVFGRLHIACLFVMIVWGAIHFSLAFPTIILFFSGSVVSYLIMWFFIRTLHKLEKSYEEQTVSRVIKK
ncbi:DUF624 domain-containing protein [Salipaludibacillus agaradhaerens]|uniref:DUF624 domain-containing protein n=1 Tax=Salipaludibacillus agaradhaerens TaxID=76935 RepID=A0A9Q4AYU2_SALAG|nr:DUF624 domain-containing protein [Salipaludibacillus agaradhaerens]MCR6094947.1 DUF624 domain-containing protein [Salipaludibacillus agaradhaerens]MCR6115495.1 DUF624 domain-containing protein [Salipaludibacillus agaradhaerens]